jgi:hypothetical protein
MKVNDLMAFWDVKSNWTFNQNSEFKIALNNIQKTIQMPYLFDLMIFEIWMKNWPEKETENGEGTNVDSRSGDRAEDSSDESGCNQNGCFPNPEIRNRIERPAFVLSVDWKITYDVFNSNHFTCKKTAGIAKHCNYLSDLRKLNWKT